MNYSPIEKRVSDLIQPIISDLGYRLVLIKITDDLVQIFAENPVTKNLGVEDCKKISKAVSVIMDVEDPISGAYRLEVSSPGIDRPLMTLEDFKHYLGHEAKVETKVPTESGQKRFRGILNAVNDDAVITIETDQGETRLPFSSLGKAKLILTDDLINKTQNTAN